jgi:hypothetical protein
MVSSRFTSLECIHILRLKEKTGKVQFKSKINLDKEIFQVEGSIKSEDAMNAVLVLLTFLLVRLIIPLAVLMLLGTLIYQRQIKSYR